MSSSNNNSQYIRKSNYTSTTFIVILGTLGVIGIVIYIYNNFYNNLPSPTATLTSSICPDYWDSIGNSKCKNTKSLGVCSNTEGSNTVDFSGDVFTNKNTGDYSKCKWAKACSISWSNIDRLC
jgi:hypothetical protein